jgi:MoaA/NifB/PqqE/SkfB family radical SAM enzyme
MGCNKVFSFANVRSVHLEITDRCNASCPMCPRTHNGGRLNSRLRQIEMSLADAQRIFLPELLQQLSFIQLCGNFGDPIAARETLEILQYFRSINPEIQLGVHTNGSGRNGEWWSQLGRLLSRPGDYCKFGLDGLQDTNHIYRRGTSWTRIMEGVRSFIAAGGNGHWEFLVFRHNEHQIEAARALAQQMGFRAFFIKKTSRFFNYVTGKNEPFPILNRQDEVVGHLYPPQAEDLINPVTMFAESSTANNDQMIDENTRNRLAEVRAKAKELPQKFETMKDYLAQAQMDCMSARDKSIYISAAGEVFPCCFLGGQMHYENRGPDGDHLENLVRKSGEELNAFDGKHRAVGEIVDGPWFGEIESNWATSTPESEQIGTCRRLCGQQFQVVAAEYA